MKYVLLDAQGIVLIEVINNLKTVANGTKVDDGLTFRRGSALAHILINRAYIRYLQHTWEDLLQTAVR